MEEDFDDLTIEQLGENIKDFTEMLNAARVAMETNMTEEDIETFNQQKAILQPKLKRCVELFLNRLNSTTNTGGTRKRYRKRSRKNRKNRK